MRITEQMLLSYRKAHPFQHRLRIAIISITCVLCILIAGCAVINKDYYIASGPQKIEFVLAYMHAPDEWSFLSKITPQGHYDFTYVTFGSFENRNGRVAAKEKDICIDVESPSINIIYDVKGTEPNWCLIDRNGQVDIHLHSFDELIVR